MKEVVYISVDGSESGKKWIDCEKNPNQAQEIGDLLSDILENMSLEEIKHMMSLVKK